MMKRRLRLAAVILILTAVWRSGAVYGNNEERYPQYAQRIIQDMEDADGSAEQIATGVSFPSKEGAEDFARYFYRDGYWGEVPAKIVVTSWSDRPSYYEIGVITAAPKQAAAQHRHVEQTLNQVSDVIDTATKDQYARAEAAYTWVYDNLEYDYSHKSRKLYTALATGKTVCFGYAGCFQVLCENLGLECEMIYGSNHVWNRVKINGEWRYVDVTWDRNLGEHRWKLVAESDWNSTYPLMQKGGV